MNHNILKSVILDQHNIIQNAKIVNREYSFDLNANYVVVGLRRAGKSTLLYKIVKDLISSGIKWEQIIYINFEDERLSEFSINDFNDILEIKAEMSNEPGWFFLDEIQIIDGWERFARRMADSKKHTFITGSNAKMLSNEIEARLGGRYLTKYIAPYNFREFLTAKAIDFNGNRILETENRGRIQKEMIQYIHFGGFPESLDLEDKREYISSIYQKVLLNDIAIRNGIRNANGLRIMVKKLAEAVKDEMSYSKLHNILKTIGIQISKDSVIDYLNYTKDSYLIFAVRNYFSKFVDSETTPKYYFSDNGILNLFLVNEDSRLLENLVAIGLKRKNREFYYLKSADIDIDFYVPDTSTAIQVAYSINNISNRREIDGLIKAKRKLTEIKKFEIITYEEETSIDADGIRINVIPIWKWLIESC